MCVTCRLPATPAQATRSKSATPAKPRARRPGTRNAAAGATSPPRRVHAQHGSPPTRETPKSRGARRRALQARRRRRASKTPDYQPTRRIQGGIPTATPRRRRRLLPHFIGSRLRQQRCGGVVRGRRGCRPPELHNPGKHPRLLLAPGTRHVFFAYPPATCARQNVSVRSAKRIARLSRQPKPCTRSPPRQPKPRARRPATPVTTLCHTLDCTTRTRRPARQQLRHGHELGALPTNAANKDDDCRVSVATNPT